MNEIFHIFYRFFRLGICVIFLTTGTVLPLLAADTAMDNEIQDERPALQTTMKGDFSFYAFEPVSGSDRWQTVEKSGLGITARNATFSINTQLEADFTGTALSADDVIKQLALSWNPSSILSLTGGKQILKWGTARVFSSIDALEPPIDPLSQDDTDRGVTGFRADLIPTWWLSFSILALPAQQSISQVANTTTGSVSYSLTPAYLDKTRLALRTEILAGETDLAFGAVRKTNSDGDEEPAFFADFARFFDYFGVYGEGQCEWDTEKKRLEPSLTGGIQVDIPVWLDGTITVLGEYRWQSENEYSEHMGYLGCSGIPLTRVCSVSVSALIAPAAKEAVLTAELDRTIGQYMQFSLEYDYLLDWLSDDSESPSEPESVFTAYRHCLSAVLTAWY